MLPVLFPSSSTETCAGRKHHLEICQIGLTLEVVRSCSAALGVCFEGSRTKGTHERRGKNSKGKRQLLSPVLTSLAAGKLQSLACGLTKSARWNAAGACFAAWDEGCSEMWQGKQSRDMSLIPCIPGVHPSPQEKSGLGWGYGAVLSRLPGLPPEVNTAGSVMKNMLNRQGFLGHFPPQNIQVSVLPETQRIVVVSDWNGGNRMGV